MLSATNHNCAVHEDSDSKPVSAESLKMYQLSSQGSTYVVCLGSQVDASQAAHYLFFALRELDKLQVGAIYGHLAWSQEGLGAALHDRMRRAAVGNVVVV